MPVQSVGALYYLKKTNLPTTEMVTNHSREGGSGEEAGLCRELTSLSCYQVEIVAFVFLF